MELKEFEKAVQRLKDALAQTKDEYIRDSVIQRFEFCVELSWKSAKKILQLTASTPRTVIRDLAQEKLISDPEKWFQFLEARNLSSHTYQEELAEKVYTIAQQALPEFEALVISLKKV